MNTKEQRNIYVHIINHTQIKQEEKGNSRKENVQKERALHRRVSKCYQKTGYKKNQTPQLWCPICVTFTYEFKTFVT